MAIIVDAAPRSVTATAGTGPCASLPAVATWNPLIADNFWHFKCINLHDQLQASVGAGAHIITTVAWYDGGCGTSVSGPYHVDDFQIANGLTTPPGRYCPAGNGMDFTALFEGAEGSSLCPAGSFCAGGAASAVACACGAGAYCPAGAWNASACVLCPAGSTCIGGSSVPVACVAAQLWWAPYEDFETSAVWAPRDGVTPAQDCATAAHGSCSGYFSRPWGRDFEAGINLRGTVMTAAGYSTATYPYMCMCVRGAVYPLPRALRARARVPSVSCSWQRDVARSYKMLETTKMNMVIEVDGVSRSVTGTSGGGPCTEHPAAATWNPLKADDAWHYKCINLRDQLEASMGAGGHVITGVVWFEGGCGAAVTGEFHIDDVQYTNGVSPPGGRYCGSGSVGGVGAENGAECPIGFACAGGTAGAVACTCNAGSYCAPGSSYVTSCNACPAGSYCLGGSAVPVACTSAGAPPGRYCPTGSVVGSGALCPSGYGCAGGATSPLSCTCGAGTHCPPGSWNASACAPCPGGFYCVGGNAAAVLCPAGSFCATSATPPVPCSSGYYGDVTGLSVAACSGACSCAAGYTCLAGASSPVGVACAAGSYCVGNASVPALCTAARGFACLSASAIATGTKCLAGLYCAGGAAVPTSVGTLTVTAGFGNATCALSSGGAISCWGGGAPRGAPAGSFARVSVGEVHACAVRANGSVVCWGDIATGFGLVGTATPALPYAPLVVDIAAGGFSTCAVSILGTIHCWGTFNEGQRVAAPAGENFVQVGIGAWHACARAADGGVQCFGPNAGFPDVPPGASYTSLGVGHSHACALTFSGVVDCWGGIPAAWSAGFRVTPNRQFRYQVAQLEARAFCVFVVLANATLIGWGGASGASFGLRVFVPTQSPPPAVSFAQLACGLYGCCGADAAGAVSCFGGAASQTDPVRAAVICPAGTAGTAGGCTQCDPGSFSLAGYAECVACPGGMMSPLPLALACTPCAAGSVSPAGATACAVCLPGTYASVSSCVPCPAGSFGNASGLAACWKCPRGYYSTAVGVASQTTCVPCGAGSSAAAPGSASCTPCTAGYVAPVPGSLCAPCAAGSYSSALLASVCVACPAGVVSAAAGATTCSSVCDVGTYAPAGSAVCLACPVGTYVDSTGSGACKNCSAGTHNAYVGQPAASACLTCDPGTISGHGSSGCQLCWIDHFAASRGLDVCRRCGSGAVANVTGAPGCNQCAAGRFAWMPAVRTSCLDVLAQSGDIGVGSVPSGVYNISVDGVERPVYCDMTTDGGGWIVVQRRFGGGLDFNRSWAEFAAGFGRIDGEQWIGNAALGALTALLNPVLRIEETRTSGERKVAEYATFRVSAPSDSYRLVVGGYRVVHEQTTPCDCYMPRGDCLQFSSGARFSTFDRDNDAMPGSNCAATRPGGWWDTDCYVMNLNAMGQGGGLHLEPMDPCFSAVSEALAATRMMIRESAPRARASGSCDACPGGTWSGAGSTACTNCSAGQFSSAGAPACQDCAAGAYTSSSGSLRCTACAAGSFAAAPRAPVCTPCPGGTYLNATGASSAAACATCGGDRYSAPGSASCALCRDGLHVGPAGVCEPTAPAVLSAVARDTGAQPGLGDRDSVLVTVNVDVDPEASTLRPAAVVSLGRQLSYAWLSNRTLLVIVESAVNASDARMTRIGDLALEGTLLRADHALPSVSVAGVPVTGSWGPFAAPRVLSAVASDGESPPTPGLGAGDALTITFDIDTNAPPAASVVTLSAAVGSGVLAEWRTPRVLMLVVLGASGRAAPQYTRVGALAVNVSGALRSRDLSSPPCDSATVVSGSWGNGVSQLSTDSGDTRMLSTSGDEAVSLTLEAGLGAGGDPVSASYSNGDRSYEAKSCVVAFDGGRVACRTVPGVGVGYRWTLLLNGLPLLPSVTTTSFAPPVISSALIDASHGGPVLALPAGGQAVRISGRNYGTVAESAVSDVVFSPRGYDGLVFRPLGCRVTVSHTEVTCIMPPFTGSNFVFRFKIGHQNTTDATVGSMPPLITSVMSRLDAPLSARGGDEVVLRGAHFGVIAAIPGVTLLVVQYGAGLAFTATDCGVTVAQSEISCQSAPGFGTRLPWRVTLLGVNSNTWDSTVAYARPVVTGVAGPPPGTSGGSVVTVTGANFADAFASVVRVLIDGEALPPGRVAVLDDRTLSVTVGAGVGRHALQVECGGQASDEAAPFWYAAPIVSTAGVVGGSGASRFVVISGANFGANASVVAAWIGALECAVTAVADTFIQCTTNASSGDVLVRVAGNSSVVAYAFDAAAAQPAPIVTSVMNRTALPLAGGGVVALSGGSLLPPPPGVGVVLRVSAAASLLSPSALAAAVCPAAVALAAAGGDACVRTSRTVLTVECKLAPSEQRTVHVVAVNVVGAVCKASAVWPVVYDAPVVAGVAPWRLRSRGGDVVRLYGRNFPAGALVLIGGAACANATRWNESYVTCVSPRGQGSRAAVAVNGDVVTTIAFAPPITLGVTPRRACAGDVLHVEGSDFGFGAPVVRVGPWAAAPSAGGGTTGDTALSVVVPVGVGADWGVDVRVGDQNSTLPRAFSYVPPTVNDVDFVDGAVGGVVNVSGRGFGPPGADISVSVGAAPCESLRHESDVQLWCTAPPLLPVGRAALVVVAGGQWGAAAAQVLCPPGFYGGAGERCAACPVGALCAGRSFEPAPLEGFWRVARTEFVPCIPRAACAAAVAPGAGGPNCAPAYTADQCRSCAAAYYRKGSDCVPCPNNAGLLVALFVVLVVGVGAVASWLHRRMVRRRRRLPAHSARRLCARDLCPCADESEGPYHWN